MFLVKRKRGCEQKIFEKLQKLREMIFDTKLRRESSNSYELEKVFKDSNFYLAFGKGLKLSSVAFPSKINTSLHFQF